MNNKRHRMQQQVSIVRELGFELKPDSVVLDLGCGNGDLVIEYIKEGYDAYGCDFEFKEGADVKSLFESGKIKLIDTALYRLPYEDKSIDLVVTDQVFEHVEDYSGTLSEIRRVLKPGGASLNFFPARYRIMEPHVHIPFASINKSYSWLLLWTSLGIRKRKGMTAKQTAKLDAEYLNDRTFYLTKAEIKKHCKKYFSTVKFSENLFIKYFPDAPFFSSLANVPFIPWLYSTMRQRVVYLK